MSRAALLLVSVMALSCRVRPPFACGADSQCGAGGRCIAAACAFADGLCSGGWRWDRSAAGYDRACVEAPADMTAATVVEDLAIAPDQATAADLAAQARDLAVVVHFYPTLQAQVVSYGCAGCHASSSSPPQLVTGDSAVAGHNYAALVDYAPTIVATLSTGAGHPLHVPRPDLDAWQSWAAAPAP